MITALLLLACGRGTGPAIATGEDTLCAVFDNGKLGCFGDDAVLSDTPRGRYRRIAVGDGSACALSQSGNVSCWGGSFELSTSAPAGFFLDVAMGDEHACALSGEGTVRCWGDNGRDQADARPLSYLAIAAAGDTSCAILQNDALSCWGQDIGTPPEGAFVALDISATEGCAVDSEGLLACWPEPATSYPELLQEGLAEVSVSAGAICTRTTAGQASCVSLGTQDLTPPGQVYSTIAAGDGFACGFVDGKDLVCWGDDDAFAEQTKAYAPKGAGDPPAWEDSGDLGEDG